MTNQYPSGGNSQFLGLTDPNSLTDPNKLALDQYATGWEKVDSNIVYPVIGNTYTFTITGEDPVPRDQFKQYVVTLRKEVVEGGGPAVESDDFMRFTKVNRKQVAEIIQDNITFVKDISVA